MTETIASAASLSLTDAQLAVVLDDSARLLVDAGAGSGKTTTVVEKICYLLGAETTDRSGNVHRVREPIALHDVAAITFTNQAAAELKRKLRRRLLAAEMPDQAAAIDGARIGTIHAFCGDVLRSHGLRAGLPPTLRVLDEGDAATLEEQAARTALQHAASTDPEALAPLLSGRRVSQVISHIVRVASDSHRLAAWNSHRSELRAHELALLDLAVNARRERVRLLDANAAIDFDLLIARVCELITTRADIRHAVQRETRFLVIDEFQDVDPPQRDIALALAGLTPISRDDAAPTRLVLVGDPKQSIYRFRRADVSLWNATHRAFSADPSATILPLRENFRSRAGILALVDGFVGEALSRAVDGTGERRPFEIEHAPLVAASSDVESSDDPCVELLLVSPGEGGNAPSAGDVRLYEAATIARRISELRAGGARYRDMAILLSTWSSLVVYQRALRDAGIPAYALRSDGFWETREIVDTLLALRAIDDPTDRVALMGFLKSPFVGARDETLYALTISSAPDLTTALRTEPRDREALDRAVAILDRFSLRRDRVPLHRFIDAVVRETGFLDALASTARGDQAIANLRQLVRFAAASPAVSLREFLTSVADLRARGDITAEAPLHDPGADVVTITSVHSAKGLEWPIVFWSDLVHEPQADSDRLQCGGFVFRLFDESNVGDDGEPFDAEYDALRDERRLEALAEQYRLWYVATTRPRRLLVLSGVPLGVMRGKTSAARRLRDHFAQALDEVHTLIESARPASFAIPYPHGERPIFRILARLDSVD